MIAPHVRNTRLIAEPAHSSRAPAAAGFAEETPQYGLCTEVRRGSAAAAPQVCGKRLAKFDPAGLADWLRLRFPQSTCHNVEAETGISAGTVENWLLRRSQPSIDHFSTLVARFGPELLAASFSNPPQWMKNAAVAERERALDEEIARLDRERRALRQGRG